VIKKHLFKEGDVLSPLLFPRGFWIVFDFVSNAKTAFFISDVPKVRQLLSVCHERRPCGGEVLLVIDYPDAAVVFTVDDSELICKDFTVGSN
jgi:hypothetical protein